MHSETQLECSEIESRVLKMKVGRCNTTVFDEKTLFKQILQEEYDICRLRVSATDEMAPLKLSRMGLPYAFSGSIRRYKTLIDSPPPGEYLHKHLEYETYDGTQDRLLKHMLTDTWGAYPIGYYRSPLLTRLVTRQKEIECVFQFYRKFNHFRHFPNNCILFIRDKEIGEYVGFFALNKVSGNLESHIGGICKKYQQSGYFYDMLRFIKLYCLQHGLKHFLFGARNENTIVQKIFEKVGFRGVDTENVFHIAPLLSYSPKEPLMQYIRPSPWNAEAILQKCIRLMLPALSDLSHAKNLSFNLIQIAQQAPEGRCRVVMQQPLSTRDELLVVMKLYGSNGRLAALVYGHHHVKR
ncbi:MAG: hypothetical protein KatS3mg031_2616 [Chitinophagales bacterium]|nr:MAG: hypothetical protein KatS3mg031_2616 [Chitinophagales bacterium]